MKDWKSKKLGEIMTLKYGSGLPERSRIKGNIPVYGSNGIVGFHNVAKVKESGVIVGRKGSAGEVVYSATSFFPIDTTYYVESNLDKKFIYYLLKSIDLKSIVGASAVPGLSRDDFYDQDVEISDLESERDTISEILSSLDDKIELNRKMNEILEEMGRRK